MRSTADGAPNVNSARNGLREAPGRSRAGAHALLDRIGGAPYIFIISPSPAELAGKLLGWEALLRSGRKRSPLLNNVRGRVVLMAGFKGFVGLEGKGHHRVFLDRACRFGLLSSGHGRQCWSQCWPQCWPQWWAQWWPQRCPRSGVGEMAACASALMRAGP